MSTSFTPSGDLISGSKIAPVIPLFTTFSAGCFVKPGQFTQPVKAVSSAVSSASFAGCFTEVFAAAPIDLDYDEPNAVVGVELELIQPGSSLHQMELPVISSSAAKSERSAA